MRHPEKADVSLLRLLALPLLLPVGYGDARLELAK